MAETMPAPPAPPVVFDPLAPWALAPPPPPPDKLLPELNPAPPLKPWEPVPPTLEEESLPPPPPLPPLPPLLGLPAPKPPPVATSGLLYTSDAADDLLCVD